MNTSIIIIDKYIDTLQQLAIESQDDILSTTLQLINARIDTLQRVKDTIIKTYNEINS